MAEDKKVVFVTGANTGLGYETIKALYKSTTPYSIVVGCRSTSNGETAIAALKQEVPSSPSTFDVVEVDVASDESINKAIEFISSRFGRLDVLVNNAGASYDYALADGHLSIKEAWNKSWDTNVAGAQVLTSAAVPLLLRSSDPRLLFLATGTSSLAITENFTIPSMQHFNASPPAGWPKPKKLTDLMSYSSAKAGLNMMMRQWHRILLNDGVKVWAVSPGFSATGLGGVGPEVLKKVSNL